MSKTVCIYHSLDLDGWMSAAIVKHWWLTNISSNEKAIGELVIANDAIQDYVAKEPIYKDTHNLWFIGYNHGQPIPDLSKYDMVIMCDISFSKEEMQNLILWLGKNFIWIDHHISAISAIKNPIWIVDVSLNIEGMQDTKFAACELTWKYLFPNEIMPEIVKLLGRYDCFGSRGTDEELKVLEFQYGARQCISNYEEAFKYLKNDILDSEDGISILNEESIIGGIWDSGKSIYQFLCTDAKQSYKNGFVIALPYKHDYHGGMQPATPSNKVNFICINKERFNPINFGIDYHLEDYDGAACFHITKEGKVAFSLYNDNGFVDCSVIAKQFGGGGHKGAAGFICDLETFKQIINSR